MNNEDLEEASLRSSDCGNCTIVMTADNTTNHKTAYCCDKCAATQDNWSDLCGLYAEADFVHGVDG